jgi:tRNA 2-thiouridine synthesizing protein B
MLHIINKSPLTNSSFESCMRVALIEDAVYAATAGNAFEGKIREAMGRFKIHVLKPDLDARGFGDRIIAGILPVDYGGFVDLTTTNNNCQSWL